MIKNARVFPFVSTKIQYGFNVQEKLNIRTMHSNFKIQKGHSFGLDPRFGLCTWTNTPFTVSVSQYLTNHTPVLLNDSYVCQQF